MFECKEVTTLSLFAASSVSTASHHAAGCADNMLQMAKQHDIPAASGQALEAAGHVAVLAEWR